jgi:hypothetical protein
VHVIAERNAEDLKKIPSLEAGPSLELVQSAEKIKEVRQICESHCQHNSNTKLFVFVQTVRIPNSVCLFETEFVKVLPFNPLLFFFFFFLEHSIFLPLSRLPS